MGRATRCMIVLLLGATTVHGSPLIGTVVKHSAQSSTRSLLNTRKIAACAVSVLSLLPSAKSGELIATQCRKFGDRKFDDGCNSAATGATSAECNAACSNDKCRLGCNRYVALAATSSYCTALGKYGVGTEDVQSDCKRCPKARYGATTGLTSAAKCTGCEAGKFAVQPYTTGNTAAATACTGECPKGQYQQDSSTGNIDDRKCVRCVAGRYQQDSSTGNADDTKCKKCVSGRFQNDSSTGNIDSSKCLRCSAGLFGTPTGQTSEAKACPGACAVGRFQYDASKGNTDDTRCVSCPTGRFQESASTGMTSEAAACTGTTKECQAGEISMDGLVCTKCPAGKSGQKTPGFSKVCTPCGIGYISSVPGEVACELCPIETVTGINYTASLCSKCLAGQVADSLHATCTTCAVGSYRLQKSVNVKATCEQCPVRGVSCRSGVLLLEVGTWYDQELGFVVADTEMHTCFNEECCTYDESSSQLSCATELGYVGPLCGGCDRDDEQGHGHHTRSGLRCAKCWSDGWSWFAFMLFIIFLCIAIAFLVIRYDFGVDHGEYRTTVQKMAFSHLQMLGLLGIFKARGTAVFNEVISQTSEVLGGSFTSLVPIKCALRSQIYGPFLVTQSSPIIILVVASLILIPTTFLERCLRKKRKDQLAPHFKGRFRLPRMLAPLRMCRQPMTAGDKKKWLGEFYPTRRLAGVGTFVIFSLYPTLVASISSLYNCTDRIEGTSYLVADLTVTCYRGAHIAFLVFASVGAVVYALGIPIVVFVATAMKPPLSRKTWRSGCLCERRAVPKYLTLEVRERFAFLFNGYSTNRSSFVVAWEALIMVRKLAVTLAGSLIKDPYLSILTAQLIIMISCIATAFVQPYETMWLNLLDTTGLFTLLVTQTLSIVYFYTANATHPFIDPLYLEVIVTIFLLVLNIVMILIFACIAVSEGIGLREKAEEARSIVLRVGDEEEKNAALSASASDNEFETLLNLHVPGVIARFWSHPNGKAVPRPPKRIEGGEDDEEEVWIWRTSAGDGSIPELAVSTSSPELLLPIASTKVLKAGESYRWLNKKTGVLSTRKTKPVDVGSRQCSCRGRKAEEKAPIDLEMVIPGDQVRIATKVMRRNIIIGQRWSQHKDEEGNVYYHNELTGKSSWVPPKLPAVSEHQGRPDWITSTEQHF